MTQLNNSLLPPITPASTPGTFPAFQNRPASPGGSLNASTVSAFQTNTVDSNPRNTANNVLPSGVNLFNQAQSQRAGIYNNVLAGHDQRVADLVGRNAQMAEATRAQQAAGNQQIGDLWQNSRSNALADYTSQQAGTLGSLRSGYSGLNSGYAGRLDNYRSAQDTNVLPGYTDRINDAGLIQSGITALGEDATGQAILDQRALDRDYQGRTAEMARLLTDRGQSARDDINRQYDQQRAEQMDGLNARGLGNTTLRSSVLRGVESDRAAAQQRLNEQLRTEQIGQLNNIMGEELAARDTGVGRLFDVRRSNVGDLQGYQSLRSQLSGEDLVARNDRSLLEAQLAGEGLSQQERSLQADLSQQNDNRREQQQIDSGYQFPYLSFLETALGNQVALGEDQRTADSALAAAVTGDRLGFQGSYAPESPSYSDLVNFAIQGSSQTPQAVSSTGRSTSPLGYSYATPTSSRVYSNQGRNYSTNIGAAAAAGIAQNAFNTFANRNANPLYNYATR